MKLKRPLVFLFSAIALALIVLAIERPQHSRVDDGEDATFSPGFDSAKVERVQISQLVYGAELKRDGDAWLVREMTTPLKERIVIKGTEPSSALRWHRADRMRVNSALGSFGGLDAGIVVSTNKDKRGLYQVDAGGLRVQLFDEDGKTIDDVIVGKNGPDLGSSYLRRSGSDEVVLVRRPLTGVFSPLAENWREKRLWSLPADDIVGIALKAKDGAFSAVKRDGTWKSPEDQGQAIDQEAMQNAIGNLIDMRADGFAEESAGDEEVMLTLSLTRQTGKPLELTVYEKDASGSYPARLSGADENYLLSAQTVQSIPRHLPLLKNDTDLK